MTMLQTTPSPAIGLSEARLAANRANAKKSTGPKTAAGKKTVSLNAYKHGLCSETILLPHEDREAFGRLRASWFQDFMPQTEVRAEIVDRLAVNSWKMKRCLASQTYHVSQAINQADQAFTAHHKTWMDRNIRYFNTGKIETAVDALRTSREGIAMLIECLQGIAFDLTTPTNWAYSDNHLRLTTMLLPPTPGEQVEASDNDNDPGSLNSSSLRLLAWNKVLPESTLPPIADEADALQVANSMRALIRKHIDRWRLQYQQTEPTEAKRHTKLEEAANGYYPQVQVLERYEAQLDRSFRGYLRDLNHLIKTGLDVNAQPSQVEMPREREIRPAAQAEVVIVAEPQALAIHDPEPAALAAPESASPPARNKATEPTPKKADVEVEFVPVPNKATDSDVVLTSNGVIGDEDTVGPRLKQ